MIFKIYRNGRRVTRDVALYLPQKSDRTLHAYTRRLQTIRGCKQFLIYATPLDRLSDPATLKAMAIVKTYVSRRNYKYRRLEAELFFGWYRQTPGGIHSESCGNFHFVLFGSKTIYLWPPGTFDSDSFHKGTRDDEVYLTNLRKLPRGSSIGASRGEAIIWLPRHWHVGHSPLASASINIALYGITPISGQC
jgi:hypothetical protein